MRTLIEAKFIGEDSLGYVKGNTYKLLLNGLTIVCIDGSGRCPYGSLRALLKNWSDVKIIE